MRPLLCSQPRCHGPGRGEDAAPERSGQRAARCCDVMACAMSATLHAINGYGMCDAGFSDPPTCGAKRRRDVQPRRGCRTLSGVPSVLPRACHQVTQGTRWRGASDNRHDGRPPDVPRDVSQLRHLGQGQHAHPDPISPTRGDFAPLRDGPESPAIELVEDPDVFAELANVKRLSIVVHNLTRLMNSPEDRELGRRALRHLGFIDDCRLKGDIEVRATRYSAPSFWPPPRMTWRGVTHGVGRGANECPLPRRVSRAPPADSDLTSRPHFTRRA